jgi:hypothetical protein
LIHGVVRIFLLPPPADDVVGPADALAEPDWLSVVVIVIKLNAIRHLLDPWFIIPRGLSVFKTWNGPD